MPESHAESALQRLFTRFRNGERVPNVEASIPAELAALFKEFDQIVPSKDFGEISLTSVQAQFQQNFFAELVAGTADAWIAQRVQQGKTLADVLVVKADAATLTEKQRGVHANGSKEIISKLMEKLVDLDERTLDLPSHALVGVLRLRIQAQLQFLRSALVVGTPEFTRDHRNSDQWSQMFSQESLQAGEPKLKHMDAALKILQEKRSIPPVSMADAFAFWKFTADEKKLLDEDKIVQSNESTLTPEQGATLFKILYARFGLPLTINMVDGIAMDANGRDQELKFPKTRRLSPDDIRYNVGHEIVHLLRGYNGKFQAVDTSMGEPEYLVTEEGLATLSELVAGQPFGHPRQTLFAARYALTSHALETRENPDTGAREAAYSTQDLYNKALEYGVPVDDAQKLVWRLLRGTSMQRKVVSIELADISTLPVAECFTKDMVYFEGQMYVFDWLRTHIDQILEVNEGLLSNAQDLSSSDLMARIGHVHSVFARKEAPIDQHIEAQRVREQIQQDIATMGAQEFFKHMHSVISNSGRRVFEALLNYACASGKINLDAMTNPKNPWFSLVQTQHPKQKMFSDVYGKS